ncbi:MAG: hypothetical protein KJ666_17675 [Bacteroidetes bacterium]|nr:hypothetical protein [Bacteroidota bacterium]
MKYINIFLFIVVSFVMFTSCKDSSSVEPETQFVQIYFKYDFKNELNTFENTFQKDLVLDGVRKINFWLSTEEQNSILEKVNEINYFSMPDTFKYISEDSVSVSIEPNPGEQILRIKYQSKDKTTIWTYPVVENDSRFTDLLALRKYIKSIIELKQEYKRLPPARGGYM